MALEKPSPLIGRTVGNFVIEKKVGEGGMGEVYLAIHPRLRRRVAVKVLHAKGSAQPELTERFYNEARAAHEVKSPHIIEVFDFGELSEGAPYLVMEWLEGRSLGEAIGAQRMSVQRAVHILLQTCGALTAAHNAGIVHRDLKPDNIFLVKRGEDTDFVKVLDFGIAKLAKGLGDVFQTTTGVLMGTPAYMSPEQCRGLKDLDLRADIYSLGVIAFQMFTGRLPFAAEGFGDLLLMQMSQPPPDPRKLVPHLPAELATTVLRALHKDPAQRYPSAAAMADAFRLFRADVSNDTLALTSRSDVAGSDPPLVGSTRVLPSAAASGESEQRDAFWRHITTLRGRVIERRTRHVPKKIVVVCGFVATAAIATTVILQSRRSSELTKSGPTVAAGKITVAQPAAIVMPKPDKVAQRRVVLRVRATPVAARLTLGGNPIQNPLDQSMPQSSLPLRLTASASGYKAIEQEIFLDRDQTIELHLEREEAAVRIQKVSITRSRIAVPPKQAVQESPAAIVSPAENPLPKPATEPVKATPLPTPSPVQPAATSRPVYRGTRLPLEKDF